MTEWTQNSSSYSFLIGKHFKLKDPSIQLPAGYAGEHLRSLVQPSWDKGLPGHYRA